MYKNFQYQLGSVIELKKTHPSKTINWEVVRLGADIKIKSTTRADLFLMFSRLEFNKKIKKIVKY